MSWKGTFRSLAAAQNRAERDARRRQRELNQQRQQIARMEAMQQARFEVAIYENQIDVLVSIHKECGPTWNWHNVAELPPPEKPLPTNQNEIIARKLLGDFKPGLVDKMLGRVASKRELLEASIRSAVQKDSEDYLTRLHDYETSLSELEDQRNLAARILAGDTKAYIQAISEIDPFSEISDLGSSILFSCEEPSLMTATLHPHGEKVIPNESKSLLKTGRLSMKKIPKTRFYELYQDYVCGCVLRVARELFALLPINMTIVTAVSPLLNSHTGHMEEQPILSVAIPRTTSDTLNYQQLDPSDSLANFIHNIKFQKTKGFSAVEMITPTAFRTT